MAFTLAHKPAFDQVKTKLPFGYAFLGEHAVKNSAGTVKACKILMRSRETKERRAGPGMPGVTWRMAAIGVIAALMVASDIDLWQLFLRPAAPAVEKATPWQMALPLPETPSIAVLDRQVSAMRKAGLPGALGLKTAAPAAVRKAGDRPDVDTLAGARPQSQPVGQAAGDRRSSRRGRHPPEAAGHKPANQQPASGTVQEQRHEDGPGQPVERSDDGRRQRAVSSCLAQIGC